jgi:hypothetical protein
LNSIVHIRPQELRTKLAHTEKELEAARAAITKAASEAADTAKERDDQHRQEVRIDARRHHLELEAGEGFPQASTHAPGT